MVEGEPPICTGKKSLIIATRLCFEPHASVYRCDHCDKGLKKSRGCKRPKRKAFTKIKCVCERNKKCGVCKGSGEIMLNRCPAIEANNQSVARLLPFFFHWRATQYAQFPDGRGRLYQSQKMLDAFGVCNSIATRCEKEEMERVQKVAEANSGR